MRQSLSFRACRSGSHESGSGNLSFQLGAIGVITAAIWMGPIRSAQAQETGALQVSATVLSVEPSRVALREALDPASRLVGTPLAQVSRTVVKSDDPIEKSRRPRTIVTIAFVRN